MLQEEDGFHEIIYSTILNSSLVSSLLLSSLFVERIFSYTVLATCGQLSQFYRLQLTQLTGLG